MKSKRQHGAQRGVALITALLMTVVFLVLMGALMAQMITELQDVGAHSNSAKALDAAYAGVSNMVLSIEENASKAGKVTPTPIHYSYASPSTAKYDASVAQTWASGNGLVYYEIQSTGTETNSGQTRSVDAIVKSFPYSYYEQFTASNSGNVYYVSGESFDGPVYNGGTMNVWYQDPATPIFNNTVQTVTQPSWYEGPAKASVTTNNVKWADVIQGGSSQFQIGSQPMKLPTFQNNLAAASEAFYGNATNNSSLPTTAGNSVYINGHNAMGGPAAPLTSGVYIQGDVQITPCTGTCGKYSGNNEVFTLTPFGSSPIDHSYNLVVDYAAKTTTIEQTSGCLSACSVTYPGVMSGSPSTGVGANGAIFVNGDVKLSSGTIHGQFAIAVPDYITDHAHTITLVGSAPGVLYKDQSGTSTDELGIWANDIYVNSGTTTGYEFDGSILTGYYGEDSPSGTGGGCPGTGCNDGHFSNVNWNTTIGGNFTFYGGLIQNTNGAMGVKSAGTLIHGFNRKYKYDPRLASNPPPFFPITNRYDIIAWLDKGQ